MPRKRNSRQVTFVKKQKQSIQKRLMQISLVVDDYVYNHKEITLSAAHMYMQEVSSFKDNCFGDERLLQVIEKLTRCMKGIISEHEAIHHHDPSNNILEMISLETQNFTQNTETTMSPVYSTADEDMTQYIGDVEAGVTENVEEINKVYYNEGSANIHADLSKSNRDKSSTLHRDTKEADKEIFVNKRIENTIEMYRYENSTKFTNVDNSVYMNDSSMYHNDSNTANVIDLTEDNENILNTIERSQNIEMSDEVYLEKAISNLSVTDNDTQTQVGNCSQSILDNLQHLTYETIRRSNADINIKNKNKDLKNDAKASEPINNDRKQMYFKQNVPNTKLLAPQLVQPSVINIPNNYITLTTNTQNNTTINPKETKKRRNRKSVIPKSNTEKKPRAKKSKTKDDLANNSVELNYTKLTNNLIGLDNTKARKTKNKTVIDPDKIEIDLSWVENIRYVREVTKGECEKVLLKDNFWDNYSLPDNWNDDMFCYSM